MSADFLDLDELYDVHKKQDSNRIQIFREIYRKCLAKMKHTNNSLRRMECNFQVPSFVWGIPIYDFEDLKDYILFRLKENGLTNCYFIDPTTLYMSWKPEDIDKKKYQAAKKKSHGPSSLTPSSTATGNGMIGMTGPALPTPTSISKGTNPYKRDDSRPSSMMMKFDDIFEVPVNLEKIRKMKSPISTKNNQDIKGVGTSVGLGPSISINRIPNKLQTKTNPSRLHPDRQLMDSWKNYFNKK